MGFIALTDYQPLEEGVHNFKIVAVDFKEDFMKLSITLRTKYGAETYVNFNFLGNDGKPNEVANRIFSFFARTALHDKDVKQVDPETLVGRYVQATASKRTYTNKDGEEKTAFDIKNFKEINGFDDEIASSGVDLASLIGG